MQIVKRAYPYKNGRGNTVYTFQLARFQMFQGLNAEPVTFQKRHRNFDSGGMRLCKAWYSRPAQPHWVPCPNGHHWSSVGPSSAVPVGRSAPSASQNGSIDTGAHGPYRCVRGAVCWSMAALTTLGHSVTLGACYDLRAIPRLPLLLPNKLKAYPMFRVLRPDVLFPPLVCLSGGASVV